MVTTNFKSRIQRSQNIRFSVTLTNSIDNALSSYTQNIDDIATPEEHQGTVEGADINLVSIDIVQNQKFGKVLTKGVNVQLPVFVVRAEQEVLFLHHLVGEGTPTLEEVRMQKSSFVFRVHL